MHSSAIMIRKVGPPCKLFRYPGPRSACAPRKRVSEQAGRGRRAEINRGSEGVATQTSPRALYACAPRKKVEQAGRGRGYMFVFVRMGPAQKGWSRPAGWAKIIGGGSDHANFVSRDWL